MKYLKDIKDWKECINEVVCGDSLELMKMIPDNAIDLCLTDPPYGIGIDGQKRIINKNNPKVNRKEHEFMGWDSCTPERRYFDELIRISKNQIIFGGNYFQLYSSRGWIFWDKGQRGLTMSDGELAWTSFDKPLRAITFNRVEIKGKEARTYHPTQKPLELMRWCLENYAKDCKTVIDPFAGSFTTAIACKDMGFDWIAIDQEEKYCEIGEKRLMQQNLF